MDTTVATELPLEAQRVLARLERRAEDAEFSRERLLNAISDALVELGIPSKDYPTPINNAVRILEAAIKGR